NTLHPTPRAARNSDSYFVAYDPVLDHEGAVGFAIIADSNLGEVRDQHVFDEDGGRLRDDDAVNAGARADRTVDPRPRDVDVADPHRPQRIIGIAGRNADDDTMGGVGAAGEDGREDVVTIDGDRFRDRHRAIRARIDAVDLPIDHGL